MRYFPTFLALGLSIGCIMYAQGFLPALIVVVFLFIVAHCILHLIF